ncbi:MAG TPA: hypothetical protein VFI06_07380 [Chitinophagaceae bacterium]|nr:hypothetical protein [Chitinophagaceae bacterium]
MKKVSFFLVVIAGSMLLNSCSKDVGGNVFIRVQNKSSKPVADLTVFSWSSEGTNQIEVGYGSVLAENTTQYRRHEITYNYPLLKFTMQGLPPVDLRDIRCGNGLFEIKEGRYTYVITEENSNVSVHIVKD